MNDAQSQILFSCYSRCQSEMFSHFLALLPLVAGAFAKTYVHDDTFTPDYVLEATLDDIQINCKTRSSVTFNGTFPGPTLYLKEEQTTWIRVYNHIPDNNVTVVSTPHQSVLLKLTLPALARSESARSTFFRWHTAR